MLSLLAGTGIIGFTASLADTVYYVATALARGTTTGLAHVLYFLTIGVMTL